MGFPFECNISKKKILENALCFKEKWCDLLVTYIYMWNATFDFLKISYMYFYELYNLTLYLLKNHKFFFLFTQLFKIFVTLKVLENYIVGKNLNLDKIWIYF